MKTLTFLLLFCTLGANAQILNIEKSRFKNDSTNFFYTDINGSFRAYNRTAAKDKPIDLFSINGNVDFAYFSKKNTLTWLNRLAYLDINDKPFNSTAYSHIRYTINSHKPLAYELFAQAQYDLLRGLDHRFLSGAGVRLKMFENDKIHVFLGLGGMFEEEKWKSPTEDGRTRTSDYLKSSNYISTRIAFNTVAHLNVIAYYQLGYDNMDKIARHRINTDTNLEFSISKILTFRVSLFTAFENAPIVPITKFTYSISNGLSIKLSHNNSKK